MTFHKLVLPGLLLLLFTLGLNAQLYAPFRFEHNNKTVDLLTLMQESNTPNLSVAFDYGEGDTTFTVSTESSSLTEETIFPLGAASAAPMVVLTLQLLEAGKIELDAPINNYLTSLQMPANRGKEITVRDLLFVKPKLGSSYKPNGFKAGEPLPNLADQAGRLKPKGNRKPDGGTEHGSWLLLQLLLEDVYGEDLQTVADREIFTPLCLESMIYASELPNHLANAYLPGHLENGDLLPGGYRRYVALGGHGLWSSPKDYLRFVRTMLDIQAGKTGSILQPSTVQMASEDTYGHRSLLFHLTDNGMPYWGGNAKGYYFSMQVNPEKNWISVVAMDRDLNWRLGSPLLWQTGLLAEQWRSEDKLGIILQQADQDDPTVAAIEHYAFVNGLRTERIPAEDGVPISITATPAYVYQSAKGRAVYSGQHNTSKAIEQFIRRSQATPRKVLADEKQGILIQRIGRQQLALPIKITAPSGNQPPATLPATIVDQLQNQLIQMAQFEQVDAAALNALDRRIYLDLHPYRNEDGSFAISYALFSQFNCHTQVYDNFGEPLNIAASGAGADVLVQQIKTALNEMLAYDAGFVPRAIPEKILVKSWNDLGFALAPEVQAQQQTETFTTPLAINGRYQVDLSPSDAPGLFFSFPAPLDRYAGEVRAMTATYDFNSTKSSLAGTVEIPVSAIATGSGSLDTYVLGDILKSEKYPMAKLAFSDISIEGDWKANEAKAMTIPASLDIRGKRHAVVIDATFTPNQTGSIAVEANFELDFKAVFGSPGPDGPDDIRRRLGFNAAFAISPETTK